jgi:hypothetical protein
MTELEDPYNSELVLGTDQELIYARDLVYLAYYVQIAKAALKLSNTG